MSAPIPNPDSALVAALTTGRAAEYVAICFHSHYERLAPDFGYATRLDSAVSWAQVPEQNRRLMIATAGHVIRDILDLVAPIDGSVDKNPNQGRGADLVRTEGEGGSRSAADAGIGGAHDASDGRVGQDHAGAPSELKPATDGDRASDPPGATHTPSLLNRRRAKDIGLMKSAQRRTLDDEGICTRCGAPDVHCMCGDVDAQIDGSGTAS